MGPIDTQVIKAQIDLIALVGEYTELRGTDREKHGPCPRCATMPGGADTDGFVVNKERGWFCRKCYPLSDGGWKDCIDFVMWIDGVDFLEATKRLNGDAGASWIPSSTSIRAPSVPKTRNKRLWRSANWATEVAALAERAYEMLRRPDGQPGRDYLGNRGLADYTWLTYRIGYAPAVGVPGTYDKSQRDWTKKAPAIVIPWYRQGVIRAIRYRFLEMQDGRKQTAKWGSNFGGYLYGGHVLPVQTSGSDGAVQTRTLLLCEGELNAMSIWQVANNCRLDVLSAGSEGFKLTDAMIRFVRQYGTVLTWFDKPEIADRVAAALPGAYAISDYVGTDSRDANDLLQAGQLGGFLAAVRVKACANEMQRERLLCDLRNEASSWSGMDAGAESVMRLLEG